MRKFRILSLITFVGIILFSCKITPKADCDDCLKKGDINIVKAYEFTARMYEFNFDKSANKYTFIPDKTSLKLDIVPGDLVACYVNFVDDELWHAMPLNVNLGPDKNEYINFGFATKEEYKTTTFKNLIFSISPQKNTYTNFLRPFSELKRFRFRIVVARTNSGINSIKFEGYNKDDFFKI